MNKREEIENFIFGDDDDEVDGRISGSEFEELVDDLESEFGDSGITRFGKSINVYKFRKVSGITTFSTQGQGNLATNPNKLPQYVQIFDGRAPITIVWEGSTKLTALPNNQIEKEIKVGTYLKCYFSGNGVSREIQEDNVSIFNVDYNTISTRENVNLICYDNEISLHDQLNYYYVIVDSRYKLYQILELKSFVNEYHQQNGKFLMSHLAFENVSYKISQTGRSVLDTIQFGAPGEEYAFPYEKYDEEGNVVVEIDEPKLFNIHGVKSIQLDFVNNIAPSSIMVYGRKKNKFISSQNGKYTYQVDTPHLLFLNNVETPKPNNFIYNTPNANSMYFLCGNLEKDGIWESYRNQWSANHGFGQYNILDQKEVRAGINIVQKDIDAQKRYQITNNMLQDANDYIDMKDFWEKLHTNQSSLKTIPWIKPSISNNGLSNDKRKLADFFNINAFYNSNVEALSYSTKEVAKYTLKEVVPMFGGLFNILMGGLDWGWTTTKTLNGWFKDFNILIPFITYLDFESLNPINKKLFPLDFFDENKSKSILPVNTSLLNSFRFTLTNYIEDNQTIIGNVAGKGGNGIWNTKYLGQKVDEDGNQLNGGQPVQIDLSSFKTITSLDNDGFIIDYIEFKEIGSSDYKLAFLNRNGEEEYSAYLKTVSKIKEDLRLWKNTMKLNYYDEFNTLGQVNWPEPVEPSQPGSAAGEVVLIKNEILWNKRDIPKMFEGVEASPNWIKDSFGKLITHNISTKQTYHWSTSPYDTNYILYQQWNGQSWIYDHSVKRENRSIIVWLSKKQLGIKIENNQKLGAPIVVKTIDSTGNSWSGSNKFAINEKRLPQISIPVSDHQIQDPQEIQLYFDNVIQPWTYNVYSINVGQSIIIPRAISISKNIQNISINMWEQRIPGNGQTTAKQVNLTPTAPFSPEIVSSLDITIRRETINSFTLILEPIFKISTSFYSNEKTYDYIESDKKDKNLAKIISFDIARKNITPTEADEIVLGLASNDLPFEFKLLKKIVVKNKK